MNDIKLSEWAKANGLTYMTAYRRHLSGNVPGSYKSETGQILVGKTESIQEKQNLPVIFDNLPSTVALTENEALADTRSNKSAFIRPADRFLHLENSPVPFTFSSYGGYKRSDVTIRDAVILCQRAYWGFSIFRATIELFTEFCVNNIYFKGGTKKSRTFFDLFFKKIGINKFQDMFYRELWRSGNCFIYRFYGKLDGQEYQDLVKLFSGNLTQSGAEIPIKYILLNPADIQAQGSVSFARPVYFQILSDYELEILRRPRTAQDKAVLDSLRPEDQEKIKNNKGGPIFRQLDTKDLIAVFLSKQSYEALAVPLGFGVLEYLNHKKELELMDQAIARTIQQAVLLVTTGAAPDQGGINYKNIENLANIFKSETVSRTIVADYTTKAEFIIPKVADILDPKKYEELNQDIAIGLGNIFLLQGEKFANQNAKIDLFLQRLHSARRLFLEEFLIPEIKNISEALGFKGEPPQPFYEEIDLKNELEYSKIYVRLMELGLLSPEEGFNAIETGKLPSNDDSIESQRAYKQSRDEGLYKPLLSKDPGQAEGRPSGTKSPQSTKKISPIGAQFSLIKIRDNMLLAQKTENKIKNILKTKHNIENLNSDQESVAQEILITIMKNEFPTDWENKSENYINNPEAQGCITNNIEEICQEHGIDSYLGSILFHSKIKED